MTVLCPLCASSHLELVLRASDQPLLLNHLCSTRVDALAAPRGDLEFHGCLECGFVHNAAFDPDAVRYEPGYVNDQSHSGVFRSHLDRVSARLARLIDGAPGAIIEVGCGQGDLLRELCLRTGRTGIGFDPALRASAQIAPSVEVRAARFDEHSLDQTHAPIALLFCRHVLEHLPEPVAMMRTMTASIADHPQASLYLEVPTFEWIAEHRAFYDLFNEHCSLFSAASMTYALQSTCCPSSTVEHVFDGQYLTATMRRGGSEAGSRLTRPLDFAAVRRHLADEKNRWHTRFEELLDVGPVVVWGGAAKGVSVVNHLGLDHRRLPHIIDINPGKQGRFVPVTGQRIIAPNELASVLATGSTPTVVIMNPNYEHEIARQLVSLGIAARIEVISGSVPLAVQR